MMLEFRHIRIVVTLTLFFISISVLAQRPLYSTLTATDRPISVDTINVNLADIPYTEYAIPMEPFIYEPDTLPPTETDNDVAGYTPYTTHVGIDGRAVVTIPITDFCESKSIKPELAFKYTGSPSFCGMGFGWSITGLHIIERVPQNWFTDRNTRGVRGDTLDAYCLDGERLIRESETAVNGQVWYKGQTSKVRVCYVLSEDQFTAYYPDGTKAIFNTGDTMLRYCDRMTRNDNSFLTFGYTANYGNVRMLDHVSYGNGREIKMIYAKEDTHRHVMYTGGTRYEHWAKLDTVLIKQNDDIIAGYSLEYKNNNLYEPIRRITRFDSVGNSMRPITMNYMSVTQPQPSSCEMQMTAYFKNVGNGDFIVVPGCFDKRSENDSFLLYPNRTPYYINNGSVYNHYNDNSDSIIVVTVVEPNVNRMFCEALPVGDGFVDALAMNANGKYGDEVVTINNLISSQMKDSVIITVYGSPDIAPYGAISNLSAFSVCEPSLNVLNNTPRPKTFIAADFNGDGFDEIAIIAHSHPINSQTNGYIQIIDVKERHSIGKFDIDSCIVLTPTANPTDDELLDNLSNSHRIIPLDYDGDGKMELAILTGNLLHIYSFTYNEMGDLAMEHTAKNFVLGISNLAGYDINANDFNGDGISDILLSCRSDFSSPSQPYSTYSLLLGDGMGTFHPLYAKNNNEYVAGAHFCTNIDNDGMTDIVRYLPSNGQLGIWLNSGSALPYWKTTFIGKNLHIVPAGLHSNAGSVLYAIGDSGKVVAVNLNHLAEEKYLLHSVTDGLGNTHEYVYGRLFYHNDGTFDLFDYQNEYLPYAKGRAAIMQYKHTVGSLIKKNVSYQFLKPVINLQGLGFCGFEQIQWHDSISGHFMRKDFEPDRFCVPKFNIGTFSRRHFTFTAQRENYGGITIRLDRDSIHDNVTGTNKSISYNYDTYGNVTTQTISYASGVSQTTSFQYENVTYGNHYIFSLPTLKETASTTNGQTLTTGTVITYNNKHWPTTVRNYYGSQANTTLTHSYTYDSRGRVTYDKVKKYNSPSWKTTHYSYTGTSRMPITKTDYLGHTDALSYGRFGLQSSIRQLPAIGGDSLVIISGGSMGEIQGGNGGFNPVLPDPGDLPELAGLKTSLHYDSFGRLDSIFTPDSCAMRISRQWVPTNDVSAVFMIEKISTGKPIQRDYYDASGRRVRHSQQRFDGAWLETDSIYDAQGRLTMVSMPSKNGNRVWKEFEYDTFGRLVSVTYPDGHSDAFSYNGLTTTVTKKGITSIRTVDAMGRLIQAQDPSSSVSYQLRPDGQIASVTVGGSVTTTFEYDAYGRRTAMNDPSAGRRETQYDAAGNVSRESDARGAYITTAYNNKGLPTTVTTSDGHITQMTYNSQWNLTAMIDNNGHESRWTYDELERPIFEVIDGFRKDYSYDKNRLSSIAFYADNDYICTENYSYGNGHLSEITINGETPVWQLQSENNRGLVSSTKSGPLATALTYDAGDRVTGITVRKGRPSVYSWSGSYSSTTGNMTSRSSLGNSETFDYDGMNRLISDGEQDFSFDALGNMTERGGTGSLYYMSQSPYAAAVLAPDGDLANLAEQHIHYNAMQLPDTITQKGYVATFGYRGDGSRTEMATADSVGGWTLNRYRDRLTTSSRMMGDVMQTRSMLMLGGSAYDAPAAMVRDYASGTWQLYRIIRDNLGSVVTVTDSAGTVVQRMAYDAWGALRNPDTGENYTPGNEPELFLIGRGFTGHEHLTRFGIINMNARLYDPAAGRFLSPDPFVQEGDNPQSFNRYSYCLNNPLLLSDPTGEAAWYTNDPDEIDVLMYSLLHSDHEWTIQDFADFAEDRIHSGSTSWIYNEDAFYIINNAGHLIYSVSQPEGNGVLVTGYVINLNSGGVPLGQHSAWDNANITISAFGAGISTTEKLWDVAVNDRLEKNILRNPSIEEYSKAFDKGFAKTAKALKITSKAFTVASAGITLYQAYSDYTEGRKGAAMARVGMGVAIAFSNCIPIVGPAVSISLSLIDYLYGDEIYDYFQSIYEQ